MLQIPTKVLIRNWYVRTDGCDFWENRYVIVKSYSKTVGAEIKEIPTCSEFT